MDFKKQIVERTLELTKVKNASLRDFPLASIQKEMLQMESLQKGSVKMNKQTIKRF